MSDSVIDHPSTASMAGPSVYVSRLAKSLIGASVALAAAFTLLSVMYAFIAFPMTDDLWRTGFLHQTSIFDATLKSYIYVDGRWFSLLVQYLTYSPDRTWQNYFPMLLIPHALVLIGLCCLAALVSGRPFFSPVALLTGLVGYAWLWINLPTGENLYWFPAVLGYWLPTGLGLITLFVLTRGRGKWSDGVVLAVSFLLPAMHEVCGGWIAGALGLVTLIRLMNGQPGARFTGLATIIALVSLAIEVMAPGVRLRAQSTPHMAVVAALFHGYQQYGILLQHWPSLVLVLLLTALATSRLRQSPLWYAQAPHLIKICLALAAGPFAILLLGAIAYSLGGGVPPRLYDGVYVLVVIGFAVLAALIGFDLGTLNRNRQIVSSLSAHSLGCVLMTAVLIMALRLPRADAAFNEIRLSMHNRVIAEQRDSALRAAHLAGQMEVVLRQSLLDEHILPTWFDYRPDPTWYANQDAELYYGIRSIRIDPGAP